MKKLGVIILAVMLVVFTFSGASALTLSLYDYGFNIDGAVSLFTFGDAVPAEADISGFDDSAFGPTAGLGTITVTIVGAGPHAFDFFIDHEIDETVDTFFNESGATSVGSAAAGQSWEIDEPGFAFGDIFDNFLSSTLDNSNAVPSGSEDDVSMAMGWNFSLDAGETATISLALSDDVADMISAFYLSQTDFDSQSTIYFSGVLDISGGEPVPEPAALLLLGTGLLGLAVYGRKRFKRTD